MSIENPYNYTEIDLKTITNEKIALKQGFNEAIKAVYEWGNEPCKNPEHFVPLRGHPFHRINLTKRECPICWLELNK